MKKLNLGAGVYYKPGYVNIDIDEQSVADVKLDIVRLPYETNSIKEIEASHILEHFDILWMPFILAEWHRVLIPGGSIYLETPHLAKNIRRFRFQSYNKRRNTIRFLYGIDIKENFHKSGYTTGFLRKALKMAGFQKIRKVKQSSYLTEKSIRIKATKEIEHNTYLRSTIITSFRQKILKEFTNLDSYFLETIENNCIIPLQKILAKSALNFVKEETIGFFTANFTVIHPKIGKIFLELFPKETTRQLNIEVLDYLEEIKFPSLLLSNWVLRKKKDPMLKFSYSDFNTYWIKQLLHNLHSQSIDKSRFDYLRSSKQKEADFFSFELINREALILLNLGIKDFSNDELPKAKNHLKESLGYLPTYFLSYWNLARVSLRLKIEDWKICNYYDLALCYVRDRKIKSIIQKEKQMFMEKTLDYDTIKPIQMRN